MGHNLWRRHSLSRIYDFRGVFKRCVDIQDILDSASSGRSKGLYSKCHKQDPKKKKYEKHSTTGTTLQRSMRQDHKEAWTVRSEKRFKCQNMDGDEYKRLSRSGYGEKTYNGIYRGTKSPILQLMFRLRGGLGRQDFGLMHEGLYTRARAGTKHVIERYLDTITHALYLIADFSAPSVRISKACGDESDNSFSLLEFSDGKVYSGATRTQDFCNENPCNISLDVKLAFFNELRHAYGRSALLLSGGAALGLYHIGVCRALASEGVLPRVVNGASAGCVNSMKTKRSCKRDHLLMMLMVENPYLYASYNELAPS